MEDIVIVYTVLSSSIRIYSKTSKGFRNVRLSHCSVLTHLKILSE